MECCRGPLVAAGNQTRGLVMHTLDILLLVVIGISGLLSFRVGLIREAFALGALLIGLLAAVVLGRVYGSHLPDLIGGQVATQVVFFFVCFLLFYILVILLGLMIARLIKTMQLRWADHLLGFLFGAIRGAILGLMVLAVLTLVLREGHPFLAKSSGYRLADAPLRVLTVLLPEKAEEALRERHQLYRKLNPEDIEKDLKKKLEKAPFGEGIQL